MLTGSRVIYSDNGTLTDWSRSLGDLFASTVSATIVAAQDKIYLGSDQPFNHRWIKVDTENTNTASVSVEIWTGSAWVSAVDVVDFTSVGGKTLNTSGLIQWTTDRNQSWGIEETSTDVTGLSGTSVYNMYWVRLSFSANLSAMTLDYVGHKFGDDSLMGGYYPDLVRPKAIQSFAQGKTTWEEQQVLASEELIRDLRKRRYIISGSQVFEWELFSVPAMHKAANIIMSGLGEDFRERAIDAQEAYQNELENTMAGLDRNRDGHLQQEERKAVVGLRRV